MSRPFSSGQKKLFQNAQTLNTDLVEVSYVGACCSTCGKYRGRIFSISGKDKRFPKLPDDFHEDCGLMAFPFIYGVQEPQYCKAKNIITYNNRPFKDTRTAEEKANYKLILQEQEEERQKQLDKIDYDWLWEHMPEICPKSFSAYRRMKNSNSSNYQKLTIEVRNKGYNFNSKGSKTMYCKNCGQPVSDTSAFCSNCGTPQQPATTHSSPQPTPQQQPQAVSYPSENNKPKAKKWYENTAVIILLLIFFFPVGLFLMWKFTGWKKIVKIIVTVIVALFAIGMLFGDNETDTDPSTQTSGTTSSIAETTSATAAADKDVLAFTSISNLTEDEAEAILKDLEAVGFDHVDSVVVNGSQSDADAGASFNVSSNGYTITLTVIDRKTDYMVSGNVVLFENGKVVDNINNYIMSSSEKGQFIYYAKEFVLQGLKAPSTAEFPGTVLEIGEWEVSRNKDVVTVRSYVDSQNSFGAMIRSDFAVQMSYTDKTCLYMEIDGTVMYGEPQ